MSNGEKRIAVVIAGSGEIKDVAIGPATTARDILATVGHMDYVLMKGDRSKTFRASDDVYREVADGDKIYAAPPAEAG
jgi:hypothetical protein